MNNSSNKQSDKENKPDFSPEELAEIKKLSESEYKDIVGDDKITVNRKNITTKLLAVAILILLVLLVKTLRQTNEFMNNIKNENKQVQVEVDKTGRITSTQYIGIGGQ